MDNWQLSSVHKYDIDISSSLKAKAEIKNPANLVLSFKICGQYAFKIINNLAYIYDTHPLALMDYFLTSRKVKFVCNLIWSQRIYQRKSQVITSLLGRMKTYLAIYNCVSDAKGEDVQSKLRIYSQLKFGNQVSRI